MDKAGEPCGLLHVNRISVALISPFQVNIETKTQPHAEAPRHGMVRDKGK
jgi:hypothetical protein